jgi:hypothetical protein
MFKYCENVECPRYMHQHRSLYSRCSICHEYLIKSTLRSHAPHIPSCEGSDIGQLPPIPFVVNALLKKNRELYLLGKLTEFPE